MTFNEKLKQALAENHNERIKCHTDSRKAHKFSLAYRLWEHKMLKNLRKKRPLPNWSLHKVRRILTVCIATLSAILVLTAGAVVGTTIGRFSFNDKHKYSDMLMSSISSDKMCIEEYYGLPEEDGWEIIQFEELTNYTTTSYKCGDKIVTFEQSVICENMGTVNTENALVEPISIYKENDGFFIEFQSGDCGLWWIYDGYLFSAAGNLDKNELVNLAHSTKKSIF